MSGLPQGLHLLSGHSDDRSCDGTNADTDARPNRGGAPETDRADLPASQWLTTHGGAW